MQKNYKKKRLIFVAIAIAISLFSLAFIIENFRNEIVFFYSPSELKTLEIKAKARNKVIRVGGLVKKNSVKKINALLIEFVIEDGVDELKIRHKGLTPDLFREGQGVVSKGIFDEKSRIFSSQELLVKHDEKYMPPEVKKALK